MTRSSPAREAAPNADLGAARALVLALAREAAHPHLARSGALGLALGLAAGCWLCCGGDEITSPPPGDPAGGAGHAAGGAGAGGGGGESNGGGNGGAAGSSAGAGGCAPPACTAGAGGDGGAGGAGHDGFEEGEDRPGGDVTVDRHDELAFSQPAPALTLERRGLFQTGKAVFEVPWVAAPGSLPDRDGLGPLFNATSCAACHARNGRGAPPAPGEPALALLLRLSVPGEGGGARPEPTYGDQIQTSATGDVPAEGRVTLAYDELGGAFGDGETFSLRRPRFFVDNTNYGPLPPDLMISPRLAQPLVGLGLLAAVDGAAIELAADPDDVDGDGVSGRVNRLPGAAGAAALGRFGWKANQPDLDTQNAGALAGDMGITSPALPSPTCAATQTACLAAPSGGAPELGATMLAALTFYTATIAVPSRPSARDPEVLAGKAIFHRLGCATCHRPRWVTGAPPDLPELAGQHIWPHSDLLLHDLGEGLADGRPDHEASGREWRTPPLWGIGLTALVGGGAAAFLHDGRARSIAEAVLWHGGEAEPSREAFRTASADDRRLLVRFVESL
jgi:CxxC motif-containing protein (DUF1111 family)